ncbi:Serine/threonine protein kinase [Agreia sp. COWG]|nr:Serine/threonine protein kinase [Agreia sp. COWG]
MANVYSGRDERLGRRVAIKLLRSSLASDPVFRTRFKQEAQAASRMAHPTIVRVFDAGEEKVREPGGFEGVVPFIVMEFVEGRLLKDIIKEGPVEPAEAIRITEGILTALEYSHRAGVVHRDIKPGNIMLTTAGQVKVMDFGIARAISDSSATVAQTTAILGTAQYFSPEQARGESVDARTDLYSTGVVLFELLTGQAPFRGDTPVAVAYQHVSETPPVPSSINPNVSPAIDRVVLHALTKDRFARFQSSAEFRTDLQTAGAGKIPSRRAPVEDFQSSLFGAPPSLTATSDSALTQLAGDDEYAVRTQSRPPVVWIWAGIASVAVIIIAIVFWIFTLQPTTIVPSTSITVPNVAGQTFDSADSTLQQLGLVTARQDVFDATVDQGRVIKTDPVPGTVLNQGGDLMIDVYVSLGKKTVSIPDVAGKKSTDASTTLTALGLVVGSTTVENSPTVPADSVIRTDPAAGTAGFVGDPVKIIASTGLVSVPDVTGQALNVASASLQSLALQVSVEGDPGCKSVAGNAVSSQSVAAGDAAQKSAIAIRYCTGA